MKILCIGHAAYDITLPVESFPTENKKIRLKGAKVECGGGPAATAAYLLAKWHVPTSFAGVIGQDYYGEKIKKEFLDIGVDITYLETNPKYATTSSYIIANKANGSRTILTAKNANLNCEKITNIEDDFDYILVDGDEFSLSNETLLKTKAISLIDAGRASEQVIKLAHLVNYLVCSNDFARDYTGLNLDYNDLDSIKKVYEKLQADFKEQTIIITLEKYGSFTKIEDKYHLVPSLEVKALDSTGAGDIYHGALLYFLSQGYELLKAMRLANITSAISVTRIGGRYSIPNLEEVLAYAD